MALVKDWTQEAAIAIAELPFTMIDEVVLPSVADIQTVIVAHCPMKPDTAYMPVPRCDSCKHWQADQQRFGVCRLLEHGNYARDLGVSRLAVAADASEGSAEFITQGSFGCVQWEAK